MKGLYDVARHLVWLTQFGLSVVVPPTLCIAGSVWLRHRFTLGGWVVVVGVVVGVLAAVSCLRCPQRRQPPSPPGAGPPRQKRRRKSISYIL